MTAPYTFTGPDGDYLNVTPSLDGNGIDLTVTDAGTRARATVTVPAWRLGDLVAAMFRQAWETAPVLLNPDEVADDWVHITRTGGAA